MLLLFVAFFRKTQKISRVDRRWLRFHLFVSVSPDAYSDPNLRGRYMETTELARARLCGEKTAHPRVDGREGAVKNKGGNLAGSFIAHEREG